MTIRLHALTALGLTAVLLGGCSIWSFGRDEPDAPAPLAAAPTGSVTGAPLPPPPGAGLDQPATGLAALSPGQQMAALEPGATVEVTRTDLLGGWTINSAGDSCQLFMTLTTWSGGYRASTRGCATPPLQTIAAWNMEGGQVQLLDDAGGTVARLYASSKTQFNGQTEGGGPVSVTR
jgi:hypothetical protein